MSYTTTDDSLRHLLVISTHVSPKLMETSFAAFALFVEHPPFPCLCMNGLHDRPRLVRHVSAPHHKLILRTNCPTKCCECRSLQCIMPLSLLLPSALLPLTPHERAKDLQLVVLGGGGGEGSGVISKTVVHLTRVLRAPYRLSGHGEQCQTISGYIIMPPGYFSTQNNHLQEPSRRPRS